MIWRLVTGALLACSLGVMPFRFEWIPEDWPGKTAYYSVIAILGAVVGSYGFASSVSRQFDGLHEQVDELTRRPNSAVMFAATVLNDAVRASNVPQNVDKHVLQDALDRTLPMLDASLGDVQVDQMLAEFRLRRDVTDAEARHVGAESVRGLIRRLLSLSAPRR